VSLVQETHFVGHRTDRLVTVQQSPLIQFAVSYSPVVLFQCISVLFSLDSNN